MDSKLNVKRYKLFVREAEIALFNYLCSLDKKASRLKISEITIKSEVEGDNGTHFEVAIKLKKASKSTPEYRTIVHIESVIAHGYVDDEAVDVKLIVNANERKPITRHFPLKDSGHSISRSSQEHSLLETRKVSRRSGAATSIRHACRRVVRSFTGGRR